MCLNIQNLPKKVIFPSLILYWSGLGRTRVMRVAKLVYTKILISCRNTNIKLIPGMNRTRQMNPMPTLIHPGAQFTNFKLKNQFLCWSRIVKMQLKIGS
jgi:hypothetical protein